MNDTVWENLSLPEIARRAAVGISTVKSLFSEYLGVSPMTYYGNLRAQAALELLKAGMTVAETADRLGFSSPNYFCLFFKKHYGVLPSSYKP